MPFRYTINAYRGCSHACTYCFARPTHEYLGLNIGRRLRAADRGQGQRGRAAAGRAARRRAGPAHHIAMGTNTDPYQRCEGKYHLTRGIVEALAEARNPFSILTKSTLILRDLDLLAEAAPRAPTCAPTSRSARSTRTCGARPSRARRTRAGGSRRWRRLNEAGIPCGVLVAPVLPGLSDAPEQLEAVVEACVDAGAVSIAAVLLHLRPGVREHWFEWLHRERPDLVDEHERLYTAWYAPKARQQELSRPRRRAVASLRPAVDLDAAVALHRRARTRSTTTARGAAPPRSLTRLRGQPGSPSDRTTGPTPNRGRGRAWRASTCAAPRPGTTVDTGPSSAARTGCRLAGLGHVGDHAAGTQQRGDRHRDGVGRHRVDRGEVALVAPAGRGSACRARPPSRRAGRRSRRRAGR